MRVIYVNDTDKAQAVFRQTLNDLRGVVYPRGILTVEVDVTDGHALMVKSWGERVLIGSSEWKGEESWKSGSDKS